MQTIADEAGVSRMAVSLALRDSPKISTATRKRIHEIAVRLGYRPNPLVSALMTQIRDVRRAPRITTTLAYATAFSSADGWKQPGPFLDFFAGAKARAESLGYALEEAWVKRPGQTEKRFCDILHNRDIHGLLVAPLPAGGGTLGLDWPRFATATIAYSLASPAIHRASNDQYLSIGVAIEHLMRLGYRRVGLAITDEQDARVLRRWSAGLLVYQQRLAAKDRVPPLLATGSLSDDFTEWFKANKPDVVLSQDPACIEWMRAAGASVPKNVGFVHLALNDADEGFAGINQNARLVGASAIDLIDAQLRRNERGVPASPKTVLIQGRWIDGPTIREQRK